jgi:hypothetical protein
MTGKMHSLVSCQHHFSNAAVIVMGLAENTVDENASDAEFASALQRLATHRAKLERVYANIDRVFERRLQENREAANKLATARNLAAVQRAGVAVLSRIRLEQMLLDARPAQRAQVWRRVGSVADGITLQGACGHARGCSMMDCLYRVEDVLPRQPVALLNFQNAVHTLCITLCERCLTERSIKMHLEQHGGVKDEKGRTRGHYTEDSIQAEYDYETEVETARVPAYWVR